MNIYTAVMFFQNVIIWRELYYADAPPELLDLNKQLGLFGDKLIVKQIAYATFIKRLEEAGVYEI